MGYEIDYGRYCYDAGKQMLDYHNTPFVALEADKLWLIKIHEDKKSRCFEEIENFKFADVLTAIEIAKGSEEIDMSWVR